MSSFSRTSLVRHPILSTRALVEKINNIYYPKVQFRYINNDHIQPLSVFDSHTIISSINGIGGHPGTINWKSMIPFVGAAYSAIKAVDRATVSSAFMNGKDVPNNIEITYDISVKKQAFKVGASLYLMMEGFPLLNLGILGVPLDFLEAFSYLTLNAARNVFADLGAKHGWNIRQWRAHPEHLKITKLTTSLIVTSLSYPLLSFMKNMTYFEFGDSPWVWVATPLTLTMLDGAIQYVSRKMRGFDNSMAKYDFFRPVVGDTLSTLSFFLSGMDIAGNFSYLILRKVFSELWTGHFESSTKRREKIIERQEQFKEILDIKRYLVPDPIATSSINFVYMMNVKSLAQRSFSELLSDQDFVSNNRKVLLDIHKCLTENGERTDKAVDFLFPAGKFRVFGDVMKERFSENKAGYLDWYRVNIGLFERSVVEGITR